MMIDPRRPMADQAIIVPEPVHVPETSDSVPVVNSHNSLEQRVQRLEDAVAALQDTHLVEERLIERAEVLLQERAGAASQPPPRPPIAQQVYDAGRFAPPRPAAPPAPEPLLLEPPPPLPPVLTRSWLILDLAAELRAMAAMFFDRSYRTALTTKVALFVLVPAILLSHWWFPFAWVPIVGPLVDKVVDLGLAFFLYKALSREAHRYLEKCSGR
jgi:hypothetical protein